MILKASLRTHDSALRYITVASLDKRLCKKKRKKRKEREREREREKKKRERKKKEGEEEKGKESNEPFPG